MCYNILDINFNSRFFYVIIMFDYNYFMEKVNTCKNCIYVRVFWLLYYSASRNLIYSSIEAKQRTYADNKIYLQLKIQILSPFFSSCGFNKTEKERKQKRDFSTTYSIATFSSTMLRLRARRHTHINTACVHQRCPSGFN